MYIGLQNKNSEQILSWVLLSHMILKCGQLPIELFKSVFPSSLKFFELWGKFYLTSIARVCTSSFQHRFIFNGIKKRRLF